MRHPYTRAERRHNGNTWRNRQRRRMLDTWNAPRFSGESAEGYWEDNLMWWARKQMQCHSDCCNWEAKKSWKSIRKRRRALDDLLVQALQEENLERLDQGLDIIVL